MLAAILKNSPTVRENVPSGHFERPFWIKKRKKKEKKGPPPSFFSKKQDAKRFF